MVNVKEKSSSESLKTSSPGCVRNTKRYFSEFCHNTSIHGFRFLGENRTISEKIWWLCVVCFALYCSGNLIFKTYQKWMAKPVLVTFSTTETPVLKVPFPAITICPEVKWNPEIFNFTDVYLKYRENRPVTKQEQLGYNFYSVFCDLLDLEYVNESISDTVDLKDAVELLNNATMPVTAENCLWSGLLYYCEDILQYFYTSEGWCISFNMLNKEDILVLVNSEGPMENTELNNTQIKKWSLEDGFPNDNDMDTYPRRTMLAGIQSGFQIDLLINEKDIDYMCRNLAGFKVTLHHPAEIPNMNKHFRLPLDQAVVASINPKMIKTAKGLKKYSIYNRKCYLPGEKTLSLFKNYTQENCVTECFINYTRESCGCVSFYMAIMSTENETVCGAKKLSCIENVKGLYMPIPQVILLQTNRDTRIVAGFLKSNDDDDYSYDISVNKDKLVECRCFPSCTSIEFNAETSQTDWNWKKTYEYRYHDHNSSFSVESGHMSRLIVYYRDLQFMTSERQELYTTIDFLANCGGLLGLFCGFSMTSAMEILYFLTLRLICNFRKRGRKFWSGPPELMETSPKRRD